MPNYKRDIKKLDRKTGRKTTISSGLPSPRDGQNGDITLRKTLKGHQLFAKIDGLWYGTKLERIEGAVKNTLQGKVIREVALSSIPTSPTVPTSLSIDQAINTKGRRSIKDITNSTIKRGGNASVVGDFKVFSGNLLFADTSTTVRVSPSKHDQDGNGMLIAAGDATAGTTNNKAGGSLTIASGRGKGSGAGGSILFKVANAGASGSNLNNLATAMTIEDDTNITIAGNLTIDTISAGVSDYDKFLVVDNGRVKYRTGAELLSDIGAQGALTFGISNTNAVKIDSSSVADDEYARFTANGLESRTLAEIKSDIGTGNGGLLPSAGSSGEFLKHDGTFGTPSYIANTDVDVSVSNLETRLGEIDSNVTIGNSSSIDTTIAGDLTVSGNNINFALQHGYISVPPRVAGGTNDAGFRLNLEAGQSTGNAVGGSIYFRTSLAGSSGTSVNAISTIFGVHGTGHISIGSGSKMLFDNVFGTGNTYIQESADDVLDIYVGGDKVIAFNEASSFIAIHDNFKLFLDGQGEANYLYSDSSDVIIGSDGSDLVFINADVNRFLRPLKVLESASAPSDTAGYGQLWVKNDTPNNLYFTNDAGADVQITNGASLAGSGGGGGGSQNFFLMSNFYHGGNNQEWIPFGGSQNESPSITSSTTDLFNDDVFFIVPYNLQINTIYVNATRSTSSGEIAGNTSIRLYKNEAALSNNVTVNISTVGYDTNDLSNVFTFDFSGETNTYSAGDIMQISIDPTNKIYYVSITVAGVYT